MLAAAIAVAYLLMPLLHHLLGTDGYYYISSASNFFPSKLPILVGVWLVTAGLAQELTRQRGRLEARLSAGTG